MSGPITINVTGHYNMEFLNEILCRLLSLIPRIIMVNPEEAGVRVTLGKYLKDCDPGWYIIWPLIQELDYFVVTPTTTDVSFVDARTKDGTVITLGIAVLYKITDVRKALFEVDSFEELLNVIAPDAARKCIEQHTNEELSSIDNVHKVVLKEIRKACKGWGLKIDGVVFPCCTSCKMIRIIGDNTYFPDDEEE